MSGNAPAGGFNFQSDAFAYVAAHGLSAQPLDWFDGLTAVPVAIAMETGGPGDDIRVELSDGRCIELQAKKGLCRGSEFDEAISCLVQGLVADPNLFGVLLVDLAASAPIRETLRQDILRLSDGRGDLLKSETTELLNTLAALRIYDRSVFRRLRIVVKDFAPTGDGRAAAISLLRTVVVDPIRAIEAWQILSDEGLALCTRRGRRDTEALGLLLRLRSDAEVRLLAKHRYREWIKTTNADFFVPALNVRLPAIEAWNQLRWLESKSQSEEGERASLAHELKRYHEWARLADDYTSEHGPIADFLHDEKRLVIIGGPGSGKSTLLRLIAHEAAVVAKTVLRVSLQLVRQFMSGGRSFEEAVAAAASQGSPLDQKAMQALLATTDLLLADGLDEAEPQRLSVANALADWALAHPQTQICVTTRPIGHQPNLLRTFREAEILPLPRKASGDLSTKLLRLAGYSVAASEEFAKPFYHQSPSSHKVPDAATIAMRNPLLLTFLVRLQIDGQPLNGCRAALYSRIIELIRRTSATDREGAKDPGAATSRLGLAALAWKLQSAPGCTRAEALKFVAEELSKTGTISLIDAGRLSEEIETFWENRRLLERVQSGSEEAITFVHLSLAEFAAAEYLRDMPSSSLEQWLPIHCRSDAWHDTIALACGAGAFERIVPLLLKMDEPHDPCSSEAMLSAAALAEMKQPTESLAAAIIGRLAARLDSTIPLLSIEAAQQLTVIAPMMRHFVADVCIPRLNHSQNWTRLGAYSVLLATGTDTLKADQLLSWLTDQTQHVANVFIRDEHTSELPQGSMELRRGALRRAFKVIFRELAREEARNCADSFLNNARVTVGEIDAIAEVLNEYQSGDIVSRHRWGGEPAPDFADLGDKCATPEFLRLVLGALDALESPRDDKAHRRLSNTFTLFHALDWWEQPVYSVHAFSLKKETESAVEVLRAVIGILDISKEGLAGEANYLLGLDDVDRVIFRTTDTTKRDDNVSWARGINLTVDVTKLIRGFIHPSELIRSAAAQLVFAGTGGKAAADELKLLLPRVLNRALYPISLVGVKVWGEEAQAVLIKRFKSEPEEGIENICVVLASHAHHLKDKAEIAVLLLEALKHKRPVVAFKAAEGIRKMRIDATQEYRALLVDAFTHWQRASIWCEDCHVICPTGSCPQCHTVQEAPHAPLIHELVRVGSFTGDHLFQLAESPVYPIKEAAILELVELARTEHLVLKALIGRWSREQALTAVLDKLLCLPSSRLTPIVERLLPLRDSASPNVRERIIAAFPSLPCDQKRLKDLARSALADHSPAVRNAAAKSIRSLQTIDRSVPEEDEIGEP